MTDAQMPASKITRARDAYVQDPWTEQQHDAMARRITQRLVSSRSIWPVLQPPVDVPRWSLAAAGALLLLLGVGIAGFGWFGRSSGGTPGGSPSSAQVGGAQLGESRLHAGSSLGDRQIQVGRFSDGSSVIAQADSQLLVLSEQENETRVQITAGKATFEIDKRPEREFVTVAAGVLIRVLGTRFSVQVEPQATGKRVQVSVERGVVDVSHAGQTSRLQTGQQLEVSVPDPAKPEAEQTADEPTPGDDGKTPGEDGKTRAPGKDPAKSSSQDVALQSPVTDAASLFKQAKAARANGAAAQAAGHYQELIERFPSDQRAGLAALELGRLRLDVLGQPGLAVKAFRKAQRSAPNDSLREDAFARLVEALDAMNSSESCYAERTRYLARYPQGVHAAAVRARCR